MRLFYIAFAHSAHTLKWVNHFKKRHELMLVSFYPGDNIEGVDFRYLPVRNKNLAILCLEKVKKLIEEFQPDILHAHYASSCGLIAAFTKFHPYVLSVWGDDILDFPKKSPVHRWVIRQAINHADYITATSNMLAENTKKYLKNNKDISIIPFGVDLEHYRYIERQAGSTIHIGTVRNLTPKYGLEYLIKAVAGLIESGSNVDLTIVGKGLLGDQLKSLVSQLKITSAVNFIGYVPNEKVIDYLRDFDIFVMPSVGEGETFGVAAVEAMATGLPVVASNIGGLPEVIDHEKTGLLVEPGNVEMLMGALKKYISSPETRRVHGDAGRQRVEKKFNWAASITQMNILYQRATSMPLKSDITI